MAKVSVILPVYNEEFYLEQALDSLLDQTLHDIEIICIDNGSTDTSSAILEKCASQDSRIHVLTQEHQSTNAARSLGLKTLPQGEFLAFLDTNNSYDSSLLEKTYNQVQSVGGADVVLFGAQDYSNERGTHSPARHYLQRDLLPDKPTFSRLDVPDCLFEFATPFLDNKLFRHDFILEENIEFKPHESSYSTCFVLTALAVAQSITYVDEDLAFHRIEKDETPLTEPTSRPTSVSATESPIEESINLDPTDFLDAFEATYTELQSRNVYEDVEKSFTNMVLSECAARLNAVQTDEERLKICTRLQEPTFTEMHLLDHPDEYYLNRNDLAKVRGAKYVVEWHNKLNEKSDPHFHVLVDQRPKDTIPCVSVIIPVYNVEPWLKECLDSVVNQSLQNIEIICVDDGSTDNSQAILLEYAAQDKRMAVAAQNNSGLSTSRNNGASLARGTYLYFIDSDDYIDPQALDLLYQRSEKDSLDVLYFNRLGFADLPKFNKEAIRLNKIHQNDFAYLNESTVYQGSEIYISMVQHEEFRSPVWFQFFNREFYLKNNFSFYEGILHEDELFTFQSMLNASRAGYLPQALYYRRYRSDSIMSEHASFSNVYGYFIVYLEMLRFLFSQNYSGLLAETIPQDIKRILIDARRYYVKLSPEEQQSALALPPAQRHIFEACIADLSEAQTELNEANSALSKTKAYLNREINENAQLHKANDSLVTIDSNHDAIDLTIIIPVYNALPYFRTCIESITGQNLGPYSLEVILIDDGSTDGTGEYCDKTANQWDYVRTIHIENSGTPARPRNIGIEEASGNYIFFCDADDYFEEDALAAMLDHAYEDGCDVGLFKVRGEGRITPKIFESDTSYKHCKISDCTVSSPKFFLSLAPWKLFDRNLIETHDITFPEKIGHEDIPFVLECYFNASNICIYNDQLYYHLISRDDSSNLSLQYISNSCSWENVEKDLSGIENYLTVASHYCTPCDCPLAYRRGFIWPVRHLLAKVKDADEEIRNKAFMKIREYFLPCSTAEPFREILVLRDLILLDSLYLCDDQTFLDLYETWPESANIGFSTSEGDTLQYTIYSDKDGRTLFHAPFPLNVDLVGQPLQKPTLFKNRITSLQATSDALDMAGHVQTIRRCEQGVFSVKLRLYYFEGKYDRWLENITLSNVKVSCVYASVYQIEFDWSTHCKYEDLIPDDNFAKDRVNFFLDVGFDTGDVVSNRFGENRVEGILEDFISKPIWHNGYLFGPCETKFKKISCGIYSESKLIKSSSVKFLKHNDQWFLEVRGATNFNNYASTQIKLAILDKDGNDVLCLPLKKSEDTKNKKFKGSFKFDDLDKTLKKGVYTFELQVTVAEKTLCYQDIKIASNSKTSIERNGKEDLLYTTNENDLFFKTQQRVPLRHRANKK